MAYVITGNCAKDMICVEACPVDCIAPKGNDPWYDEVPMLYINPQECTDCGACVPVCPLGSIYPEAEVPPEHEQYIGRNAAYFR